MKSLQQFSKKYLGSILVLIFLIGITSYIILKNHELNDLVDTISTCDIKYLLIGVGLVLCHILFESFSMQVVANALKAPFSVLRGVVYTCIDLYYSAITPSATGGQPVLAYYMNKDGIPISKSSIVLLLYTIMYKVVLLFLGICVMIFHGNFIFNNGIAVWVLFFVGVVINLCAIGVCLLSMFSEKLVYVVAKKLFYLLAKIHLVKQPEDKLVSLSKSIEEYHKGAAFILENGRVLFKMFIHTVVQRVAFFSVSYCVYRSFGLKSCGYFDILALQVVISIAVDSLPLPGAVGVTEGMFLLLYHVVYNKMTITPAMIITRGITFYFSIIFCGIVTVIYHVYTARKNSELRRELEKSDRFL
ncbi:integral membrane protein [Lachnospiraceae bacterium KM106-2]|nr:integral membrane protein [Lachnospiraceae bacterium KM106-2]